LKKKINFNIFFTSLLFYYYDVNSKKDFDTLFKSTYVYSHPTKEKNSYYILKFDFSGIVSGGKTEEELISKFDLAVKEGIMQFNTYYKTDFLINEELSAEEILVRFLLYFDSLGKKEKIFLIIDEYDNFTNSILEGDAERFKNLVGNEGIVKAFYSSI